MIVDGLVAHLLHLRLRGALCDSRWFGGTSSTSEAKGGFALLRPPRGPPEHDCPTGNLIKMEPSG